MNKTQSFFLQLTLLTTAILVVGSGLIYYKIVELPSMFFLLVVAYFFIALFAFFINIEGTKKESEIGVWYFLTSVMFKFFLAISTVVIFTKFFPEEKRSIIFTNFVLYPLFQSVVILDIYKRISKSK